ncbi:hypothetical protein AZF37_00610 [endosymbiont 'TC1' of Trimyema compressum]|uniref:zinc ribbon domain-containing protein n=1 Tax=endosymbiont 'TC1' of Trimyema compressum TaxID=243899 RepID=UPI0007F15C03|nr:zinc ribbon domain-containing protein [endosymbiont 'TC1' of Trimyema compressum]AMP19874.1 hypothetical protein AZF37_00610 [endosymbiont 'TC1' of Trimyema compressum]
MFAGVLKCADCGSAMTFNTKQMRDKVYMVYKCSSYVNRGKNVCSIHSVALSLLEDVVLQDIRNNAKLAASEQEKLIKRLMKYGNREQEEKRLALEKSLCEAKAGLRSLTD